MCSTDCLHSTAHTLHHCTVSLYCCAQQLAANSLLQEVSAVQSPSNEFLSSACTANKKSVHTPCTDSNCTHTALTHIALTHTALTLCSQLHTRCADTHSTDTHSGAFLQRTSHTMHHTATHCPAGLIDDEVCAALTPRHTQQ